MTQARGECEFAGEAGAEVEIRPMSLSDLDGVTAIEQRTFANPWSRDSFERDCMGDGTSAWVAVRGGEVEGYVVSWIVCDEIHVGNIAVAPGARRRGTGRRLLERALSDAAGKGVRLATLEARESNTVAIRLYESFAFRPVAIRRSYYADSGEDAIVMIADLGPSGCGAPPEE